MFTLIENYDVQETRRLAREEGKAEGEARGKSKMAIKMLKKGYSLQEVAEITEMPLDRVEELMKAASAQAA
jgi:predicted transposase/invertase (TIGR01784 family)